MRKYATKANLIFDLKNYLYILLSLPLLLANCKHDVQNPNPQQTVAHNYPENIKTIIVDKCATAGCHNATSYKAAGNLRLDSWSFLFDGSSNGAVVVPYNADNSSLLYFVNTDEALGTVAIPTMPYNAPHLTRDEYFTLRDWINNGAPDANGAIAFSTNPDTRQKVYTVQQGCDLVAVADAEKNVVMRYITVGQSFGTENPNNIVISADGKYAYVSFWNAPLIQKIDTETDSVIAELNTSNSFQKAIQISNDGTRLIASNWFSHDLILIDATTMQIIKNLGTSLRFLGGFAEDSKGNFYATSQFGNTVYKIAPDGSYTSISIDGLPTTTSSTTTTPDPISILMNADKSKYFVTCTNTNEVRVLDAATDQLIKTISVGGNPQQMALAPNSNKLFVTCMNDTLTKIEVGSLYVIDENSYEVVKKITNKFFQPYGIAVDQKNNKLFIFNRNEDKNGPPPHHQSPCNGRNGFYQVYDLNTLTPATNKRFEVTVDPYASAIRFK
ncbi:MAG: c-type cytochrome domain-containing protein [Flavipsychrobacter sp.]